MKPGSHPPTPADPIAAAPAPTGASRAGRSATRLRRLLGVAALALALPAAAADRPELDSFTQRLAQRINDYRQQNGLEPLSLSEDLMELATEHSQDMAEQHKLSHDGFRERRRRTNSRICVENVAHNFPSPETLVTGWRESPSHHRNLLEPKVLRMGLAATARYVTFFACR